MKNLLTLRNAWGFAAIALLLTACGQPDNPLETKQAALEEKRSALRTLENEISQLEQEIADLDTTVKEDKRSMVKTATAAIETFSYKIEVPGRADSRQNIIVSAEAMGNITRVAVDEGQMVKKGALIAVIESDVLQSQISELETRLELATTLYEKQKRLWDQNIGSEVDFLQAKNNKDALEKNIQSLRTQLRNSNIYAPISGYIDEVFVREGQLVNMGSPAARVVDLKHITVEADVSEAYIGDFSTGDTVTISFPSINKSFKTPISAIGQVVNADDRTFTVEVELDNSAGLIKPNVLGNMRITTYHNPKVVVLPTSVIQQGKTGDFVFVISGKGAEQKAVKKTVVTGKSYKGRTEILEGLKPGEEIVVVGARNISDGEPIRTKKA